MADKLIHQTAVKFADSLNANVKTKREGNHYLKLVYGLEVIVMNVFVLSILFAAAVILGTLPQSIVVLVGFNVIRRYAHGAHAKSSLSCSLTSSVLFIIAPWLLKDLGINNYIVAPVFCVILLILFLYAPADTESKPLVGRKKRAHLRKCALIAGTLLTLCTLLIPNNNLKMLLTLGAVYEAISILPVTYIVLNKKYKNYKLYEDTLTVDLSAAS